MFGVLQPKLKGVGGKNSCGSVFEVNRPGRNRDGRGEDRKRVVSGGGGAAVGGGDK